MKGLEISREYYKEFGEPMLQEKFPELMPYIAVAVFGSGSECFGFDDEVSRDHDFDPGFMIFLPGEEVVGRKEEFALERAYAALPKEYMGVKRPALSPVGGNRRGVTRTEEFFREKIGLSQSQPAFLTSNQWLTLPSYALAEVTNGEIFMDGYGEITAIREALKTYPTPIKMKKLAGNLLLMAQSGQYNYLRCIEHGETAGAQLAVMEFAKSCMETIFLLNDSYMPFYKWAFRAMRNLPKLSLTAELLEYLITTDNEGDLVRDKYEVMEGICGDVAEELINQNLTKATCGDLEKHAYSVNDEIKDSDIRNLHILAAV